MEKVVLVLLAFVMLLVSSACSQVPLTEAPQPINPVQSSISKFEAPERVKAPEPQKGAPAAVGCG